MSYNIHNSSTQATEMLSLLMLAMFAAVNAVSISPGGEYWSPLKAHNNPKFSSNSHSR